MKKTSAFVCLLIVLLILIGCSNEVKSAPPIEMEPFIDNFNIAAEKTGVEPIEPVTPNEDGSTFYTLSSGNRAGLSMMFADDYIWFAGRSDDIDALSLEMKTAILAFLGQDETKADAILVDLLENPEGVVTYTQPNGMAKSTEKVVQVDGYAFKFILDDGGILQFLIGPTNHVMLKPHKS